MSGQVPTELSSSLRRLVPAGVAVAATATGQSLRPLTASECRTTSGMAPQRQLEFTAGRSCAHQALGFLGIPSSGIPVGPQREPLWPSGIVGSISHCDALAVAAVAPNTLLRSIGVDIEPATPLDRDLQDRICSPAELARLRNGPNTALRAKMVFSAKESVYKCVWPLIRQFLEFSDVEIVLGDENEDFAVVGGAALRGLPFTSLAGRITVSAGHIITVAYIGTGPVQ